MGASLKKSSEFWRKVFLSAATPAFITLLGLFAGIDGAVYTDRIGRAFPFHWHHLTGGWSWPAIVFWSCAAFSAVLYFFREKVVDFERKKDQKNLVDQARELEHLIRTHPPANFLAIFSQLYEEAAEVAETALSSNVTASDKSLFGQSIRYVLRSVAILAQKFDGDIPGTNYAVNIMIFKPVKDIPESEHPAIRERLQFCEAELSVKNLRGILDLEAPLSTTASDKDAASDPGLKSFALPIPVDTVTKDRSRVLPGAPFAFVSRELDMYTDTRNIREWCDKYADFTLQVKEELQEYFNKNPNIRSFVSLPIFSDRKHEDPIAVLNIHSNKPGLLKGDGEPVAHFADLMSPFQVILTRLVSMYLRPEPPTQEVSATKTLPAVTQATSGAVQTPISDAGTGQTLAEKKTDETARS